MSKKSSADVRRAYNQAKRDAVPDATVGPRRIRKGEPGHGEKKFVATGKHEGKPYTVRFGDANMEIRRDDPGARKNFRARHSCDEPGPPNKARYWSCKMWSGKPVSKITK